MKSNIYSLYIIKIAKWFNLVMPTIVLFYQNLGMGMQDIFMLKAIYSVVIVVFEIPSGYCADAWGRKKTLLAGSVLGTAGFLIYSTNTVFAGFVVAELILGLGHSLISGADTAMLYDTLKSQHKASAYLKHEGRITAGGNFAEALAGIAGGLLATISLRTPFIAQVAVASSAIPAALLLKEPALNTLRNRQRTFKALFASARHAVTRHATLPWVLLLSAFTGTATLTYAWLVQPYFKAAGLPLALYGVMWTLLNLSVGTVGLFAHRLEAWLGQRASMIGVVVLIAGSYFLTGRYISLQAVAVLFIFHAVRGMATPVLKEYINRDCASEVRATIMSVRNFIIRINFAVAGPVLGWVVDHRSLNSAYWLAGGAYMTGGGACLCLLYLRKHAIRPAPEKT